MSLYNTPNVVSIANQTTNYTANNSTDVVPFLITSAATLTLPAATGQYSGQMLSNRTGGQGILYAQNSSSSTANVAVAAGSGDTVSGVTSIGPGQVVRFISNGSSVWTGAIIVAGAGGLVRYQQTCAVGSFTDGGSTSGTLVLGLTIPAGARYVQTLSSALVGFAGDTTAVAILGDGSDTDRYNTSTPNFFTTAAAGVDMGAPSGTAFHSAAISTVTLTVTSSSDFTLVKTNGAGSVVITMLYWSPF
jgi:hypothetical protein